MLINAFRLLTLYLKPVLPKLAAARRGIPQHRAAALGRRRPPAAAGAPDQPLRAPDDAHRGQADRRPGRRQPRIAGAAAAPRPSRIRRSATPSTSSTTEDRRRPTAAGSRTSRSTISRKVDLRIARIANAEHVEGADKLIKLTLDLGARDAQGLRRHQVGLRSGHAGRPPHGDGRQPRAAQDEVRHVAKAWCWPPPTPKARPPACSCSRPTAARSRACG